MNTCKFKNTSRIIIYNDKIDIWSCGFINCDEDSKLKNTYKINKLSKDLKEEITYSAYLCDKSSLNCCKQNFKIKKVELYIFTTNKKSIKTILDKLRKIGDLTHIIFWETPNSMIDNFIFRYIRKIKASETNNIIFRAERLFNSKKLKKTIVSTFEENIYFEIVTDITEFSLLEDKNKFKKLLLNIKLLDKYKMIKKIKIPIYNKKGFKNLIEKLKEVLPPEYFNLLSFYPKNIYLANFDKFLSGNMFGNYNSTLFDEDLRGNEPYYIRYKGNKDNLNLNIFEVINPKKEKIAEFKRENIEELANIINKNEEINLFLDLKSNYITQLQDYMLILDVLKNHSIFEITLGKSNILKFESYKFLSYITGLYFVIIESLDPDVKLISNFRETLDFKVYGVIEDISDWKKFQPLVEQKYIDRIIYIEYHTPEFEKSKAALKEYYDYVNKNSTFLFDRFYIYPDYMIEDDTEIVNFYKEHNSKRRPYYEEV